jgi:hypothetical protein
MGGTIISLVTRTHQSLIRAAAAAADDDDDGNDDFSSRSHEADEK